MEDAKVHKKVDQELGGRAIRLRSPHPKLAGEISSDACKSLSLLLEININLSTLIQFYSGEK